MRKIREYQEQQQHQDVEDDESLSDDYLGNYVDSPPLSQEETVEHYEGEEIDLVDTEEESAAYRIENILRNIRTEGYAVDSIVVDSLDLKDRIMNNDEVTINKDSIIVREDLETDFVVRYINADNKIYEVV